MDTKMYIPKRIKVGYQERHGTYTGKLAYVTYFDEKNKLRKEPSWNGWRDDSIDPEEFDNEPMSGFVLNKGVGGQRHSYGWNARNEYIRVYDPRNFEFEISVANLLFILQETSSIKGKGLEGEFVYCWSGAELNLIPTCCEEYKECVEHTQRQKVKFDKKDIKEGCTYLMKDGTEVLYIGRFSYNDQRYGDKINPVGRRHVFLPTDMIGKKHEMYPGESYSYSYNAYIPQSGYTKIAERLTTDVHPEFANEYEKFKNSEFYVAIKEVKIRKATYKKNKNDYHYLVKEGEDYYLASINEYGYGYYARDYRMSKSNQKFKPTIKDKSISIPHVTSTYRNGEYLSKEDLEKLELYTLTIVTEDGQSFRI